jgi:nuclear pore complex protein Nup62
MNSNFFNRQSEGDGKQKNPFASNPFGMQGEKPGVFGSQQQPGVFGQQSGAGSQMNQAAPTGFGGAFGTPTGIGAQGGASPFGMASVSPFEKPAAAPFGSSNVPLNPSLSVPTYTPGVYGSQGGMQGSTDPFRAQQATAPNVNIFGGQQVNGFQTQQSMPIGNTFASGQGQFSQPSGFSASVGFGSAQLNTGVGSVQGQGSGVTMGVLPSSGAVAEPLMTANSSVFGFGNQQSGVSGLGAWNSDMQKQMQAGESQGSSTPMGLCKEGYSGVMNDKTTSLHGGSGAAAMHSSKEEGKEAVMGDIKGKHTLSFGQVSGEKGMSFIQMTLGEIIQQQTRKLEENIKMFKEKAKEVFDQDERIIKALNNYRLIRSNIDEEERAIAETEENVEFFEKWLSEFQEEVADGPGDELLECIKEFERICDKYNKTIEMLRDEDDEVMCLVNENYNLINVIDEKLDVLERY